MEFNSKNVRNTLDQDLVNSCRRGDRRAQKALYDLLAPKMYALCRRYVGNGQQAEDLLQDGFVTIFTKLDSYKGDGSFEGWARKIFVNLALMNIRKKDVMKESEDVDAAWDVIGENSSPIQDMGYKELMKLIEEMPAGLRVVFNLAVIEGYSHKDIAEMLDTTEVNSRSTLSRGRAWLQSKLKEYRQ